MLKNKEVFIQIFSFTLSFFNTRDALKCTLPHFRDDYWFRKQLAIDQNILS